MNTKKNIFFALIFMILLSATALAAPTIEKAPIANFTATPRIGNEPLKVVFTDRSTGSPTSWKWNFGDGKTSNDKSPVHIYSKIGKYNVTLTVKNAEGNNTVTKYDYITVLAPLKRPIANFTATPRIGTKPLKVVFTDRSTGSPTSWKWIFGDGKISNDKSPVHVYSKVGKYNVTLIVKNAKGTDTKTRFNYVTVKSK